MRDHDVTDLTACELKRARRDLQASLGLVYPGSPMISAITAQLSAIDAELAERAKSCPPHDWHWVGTYSSETTVTEKCSKCGTTLTYPP